MKYRRHMTSSQDLKPQLTNLSLSDLSKAIAGLGEPSFRVKQVMKWLYQKRVESFDAMANVSKESRGKFGEHFTIEKLAVSALLESSDRDAVKFGFLAGDGWIIESVLLIDGDRRTACVSSQIGCGLGCVFCETGGLGLVRNLTQAEILGQIIGINDYLAKKKDRLVTNIVFMGMGEALANFDAFMSSLEIIRSEEAFNIGSRRITVSTAGVIPSIRRLMERNIPIGLAISLNSYSNEKRSRIMPVNEKYPIESLVEIAREYFEKTGRQVTFEYVLIKGENDGPDAIESLVSLLQGIVCKINIISVNPSSWTLKKSLPEEKARQFADSLYSRGLSVTLRKSRGKDIKGACGQLTSYKR